ncbi:MAG TPA: hypothetical protein VM429_02890 [Micropruina sp.]|nr:hypothetical protein [Micropruina sp.]
MRKVYKVLAFAIAGLVVVQAAAVTFAVFGLFAYIEGGGTIDAANSGPESDISFPGVVGFMIHGMFGTMVIPLIAILLLVSSFFAKTAGAIKWAVIVFVTTAVQIGLGLFAHGIPQLGILHGIVALVLFGAAIMAGMRARPGVAAIGATEQVAAPVASA